MGVNGCQKGKDGERELAKLLGKWWNQEFVRSPGSGAFMTVHAAQLMKQGYDIGGDLICPEDFPFSIECKRYKQVDLYSLIRNFEPNKDDQSHPVNWWKQCQKDAIRSNKSPLVIFRENGKQWYALGEIKILIKIIGDQQANKYLHTDQFVIFPLFIYLNIFKETFLNLINDGNKENK